MMTDSDPPRGGPFTAKPDGKGAPQSNGHGYGQQGKRVNGDDSTLPAPSTHNNEKGRSSKQGGIPIKAAGESGRRGIHPGHFFRICFRSASRASLLCNLLWPFVPAAIAVRYTLAERHTLIFSLTYIAMVPCANLVGFAGQELARKVPHVAGVLTEITCGSVVEIVLFMVLLDKGQTAFPVIRAAILGSILSTMLLCLGICFFVGGVHRNEQTFSEAISETGSGLLLTAGVALSVPTIFQQGTPTSYISAKELDDRVVTISRILSILLIMCYGVYVFFQARSHHGIYDAIFEYDEERDRDKKKDDAKAKLTMTECVIALVIAIALVTFIAITLVLQIEEVIKESGISDTFMGLILVPLVEKFAEHLTAIDEAWDNQMNLALSHVLGATLQTALFNAPLVVIVAWGLDKNLDLHFDSFSLVVLILSILTVGRFLQDQKSNYLEGFLLIMLYIAVAVCAFYYPEAPISEGESGGEGATGGEGGVSLASRF